MRLLLSVFLLLTTLFADNTITATTENDPSSLVDGVNVITGDLYVFEEDYIIQGAQPISIRRSYVSREGVSRDYDYLICSFREGTNHFCILEPNGTALFYLPSTENKIAPIAGKSFYGDPEKKKKWKPLVYETKHFVSKAPGVSNTSSGKVSAHTNLKNQRIVFDPNIDFKGKSFTLYASNGTKRRYVALSHQEKGDFHHGRGYLEYFYRLVSEELPHGHVIHYSWDDDNHLREIYSTPKGHFGKKFASAKVPSSNAKKPSAQSVLTGSDGRSLTCHRQPTSKKRVWLPHLITSPENPDQSFHWVYSNKLRRHRIEQFILPQGRVLQVTYDDTSESRVKTLSSPVGKGNSLVITHTFEYDPKRRHSSVVDAKGNKTAYSWNDQYRLTRIDRYEGSSTLRSSEHFVWEGSELKCKTHIDETGQALFSKTFLYDTGGNVKEERFYGNLSGKGTPLQLDGNGLPVENGVESAIRKVSYTSDGTNLPLREEEPNGLVVAYTYLPGTHLPTSKLLLEGDQIKVRTLYGYDGDFILRREIVDDGSSQDPNNLSDVTVRTIKEITPRQSNPYIGLPETVEEKYWDGAKEILLKKESFYYTTGALVEKKEVFDGDGRFRYALTYSYDPKGRLEEETNPIGQRARYRYDDLGNQIYAKDFSGRKEIFYEYDLANRLTKKIEKGFDGIEHQTLYAYDETHNLISATDPYGNTTCYGHDLFGNTTKTTLPMQEMWGAHARRAMTQTRYDSMGNATLHTDAEGNETKSAYNALGKPVRVIHPDGGIEENTYHLDGTLAQHIDPLGVETHYKYDTLGRIIEKKTEEAVQTFVYKGNLLLESVDAEGTKTLYRYDGAGRKIAEETAGEAVHFSYDNLSRIASSFEGDLVTSYQSDLLDRKLEENKTNDSGLLLQITQYDYDAASNQTVVIQGKASTERFDYDSFNRCIRKTDPLGAVETTEYETRQNSLSQKVPQKRTTDPLGLQTIEMFDAQHRTASLEKRKDKTLLIENLYYDLNGQKTAQEEHIYNPDGSQRTILNQWEYDSCHRLLALMEGNGSKTTKYEYNLRGDKTAVIKPDGTTIFYEYSRLGFLNHLFSSDRTVDHRLDVDRLGRLIGFDGITRRLDARGRILEETFPNGVTVKNRYDSRGRKEECTIPSFDLTIEYKHGPLDLEKVMFQNHTHAYTAYDLAGNLFEESLIGHLGDLTRSYDLAQRPLSLQNAHFTQNIEEYDPIGNILKMHVDGVSQTYTYDDLYQLSSETGSFCHSYTFDALYNRLSKDTEQYALNALNQAISHGSYDLNGNPIQIGSIKLFYDALERLIRVEAPDGIQLFAYDYLNRPLSQTNEEGKSLCFLYDGQKEIGSFDEDLRDFRVLGRTESAEIGAAVAVLAHHSLYAPIHDLQGNIATLIPVDQGPASQYRYSAFGEEQLEGSAISPWRFSSKRVDPLTGFVNYGRRYYVPSLGRWLTPDPLGFAAGMNVYAFVQNDPLTHFDEYGLYSMPISYTPWQQPSDRMNRFSTAAVHESGNQALDVGRFFASSPYQIERGFNYLTGRQNYAFAGWHERQNQFFNKAEDWIYRVIPTDRNHPDYLTYRRGIGSGIELGTYLIGGYGLAKGGLKAAAIASDAWKLKKSAAVVRKKVGSINTHQVTPTNFFSRKTYDDMDKLLIKKFGPPRGVGPYNKSFYNSQTKRTFNLHKDPLHHNGKAHIDVRKRGLPSDYYDPFFLKE